jgi:ribosomal protein S18 acetylase RimI-like enzyme
MSLTSRPYAGAADLERIMRLVFAYPERGVHVADMPYRLSSWSLDDAQNARLWEDEGGRLLAFAIVQEPFLTLDYLLTPAAQDAGIEAQAFAWAAERGQVVATKQGRTFPLYAWLPEDDAGRRALLGAHGFARSDWEQLHLARSLDEPVETPAPPAGFTLRQLHGNEVAGYVALHRAAFGSRNMSQEWRDRTLRLPQYLPALDLVAEAPGGRLAAFCVCWLHAEGRAGHVEPLGVHPDFQRLGLGRAVLLEGLRRMQAHGATTAGVHTDGWRDPARRLYEGAGFQVRAATRGYGRVFTP